MGICTLPQSLGMGQGGQRQGRKSSSLHVRNPTSGLNLFVSQFLILYYRGQNRRFL